MTEAAELASISQKPHKRLCGGSSGWHAFGCPQQPGGRITPQSVWLTVGERPYDVEEAQLLGLNGRTGARFGGFSPSLLPCAVLAWSSGRGLLWPGAGRKHLERSRMEVSGIRAPEARGISRSSHL